MFTIWNNSNQYSELIKQYNRYSAVYAWPSTSDTACSITYSSINSNEANENTIIWFNRNNENYEITQSNIINNIDKGSYGLIECDGPTNIKDCCIMNNNVFDASIIRSFLDE